ncbi:hypothetical protein ACWGLK_27905, partial [Streptomyces albidoflavus]
MQATATVLVYSDNSATREQVRLAAGRRPAADVPPVRFVECATLPAVLKELEHGGIDACVLDGETAPIGGMGVCRQLKDEIFQCPPVLLLMGRPQDAWLATWRLPHGLRHGRVRPVGRVRRGWQDRRARRHRRH